MSTDHQGPDTSPVRSSFEMSSSRRTLLLGKTSSSVRSSVNSPPDPRQHSELDEQLQFVLFCKYNTDFYSLFLLCFSHELVIQKRARSPGPIYNISEAEQTIRPRTVTTKFGTDSREKYLNHRAQSPGMLLQASLS